MAMQFGLNKTTFSSSRGTKSGKRTSLPSQSLCICFAVLAALLFSTGLLHAQSTFTFSPAVAVGSTQSQVVPVTVKSAGTLATVQVLTLGAPNLDFQLSQSCPTGVNYAQSSICSVTVNFAPLFPGTRNGAVVLLDSSGNVMATQLLSGIGHGPLSVMEIGELVSIAGNGHLVNDGDAAVTPISYAIHEPLGVAVDGNGNVFYSDSGNNVIRRVNVAAQTVTNIAGIPGTSNTGFSPDGTVAANALISNPGPLVLDGAGNLFFSDIGNNVIRKVVLATGKIYTVAGSGGSGYTGDNGLATAATFYGPEGLTFDAAGNLYIADAGNNVIRRVDVTTGIVTTVAGTGTAGFNGDGGPATAALLNQPWATAFDANGNMLIADFYNNCIRKVTNGTISTFYAIPGAQGTYTGDGSLASQATLNHPTDLHFDAAGNLFIADSENNVIRKINGATQIITTVAGNGYPGDNGDLLDATAASAEMNKPYAIALDSSGNLFIADRLTLKIREVYAATGILHYQDIKVTNSSPTSYQSIENDGNAPLHLSAVNPVSNSAIDTANSSCNGTTTLQAGSTCVVGVIFKPTSVGSPVAGQVNIVSDSPTSPIQIIPSGNSLSIFPTTTVVAATPNPAGLGTSVTISAVISSAATSPVTGTVSFYDNGTLLGGAGQLVNSSNTASFTTSTLTFGPHPIIAVYSGDGNNATSTSSPAYVEVIKQIANLTLSGNPNPAQVYGQVTFTANVAAANSGGTLPTGSVTFSADGNGLPSGTVNLVNGVATYTTALLAQGQHVISFTYSGDANTLPGSSATYSETVNYATATVTLSSSNLSVPVTTPVTFAAVVSGVQASTPTGNVVFKDGTNTLGTAAVSTNGVATLTISTLASGTHSITANYQGDTDYATATSPAVNQVIQKIDTSGTITASASPVISGASVRFVVNLAAAATTSPNQPITGTVTLMDGATLLGTGNVTVLGAGPATATVTIPSPTLAPGNHSITANYSGDGNYNASTSSASILVNSATTSSVLAASATTIVATKSLTLTTTVTGNGAVPGGTVTFTDGANTIGSAPLNASGVASISLTTLSVGAHTIVAVYGGDTDDSASTSNSVTVTVNSAATTVALTPTQNPTNYGQSVGFSAVVSGNGSTPTGTVTFSDSGTPLATVNLSGGAAAFNTSTLSVGNHLITASYSGDAIDQPSNSSTLTEHVLQTITLSVTSGPTPSVARSNVHIVAVIAALEGIQPTGTITFKDGNTVLGTSTIAAATAAFDISTLSVGSHQIIASYAGDGTSQPLDSAPYTQVVNAAGTNITIAASSNPATFGAPLVLTATASSPAGSLSGNVVFQDGTTNLGQGTLNNGVATLTLSNLTPGVHSIVAAYQGDSDDAPAISTALPLTVERTTTIAVSSNQNPLLTLAPVVISAAVANGGSTPASGTVTFSQDGAVIGKGDLAGGVATFSIASLPVGDHTFSATYAGDAVDFPSASANFTETVQLRATTAVINTTQSSLTGGQQLTISTILRWTGPGTPTGTVVFSNNGTAFGSATVDASGVASFTALFSGSTATLTAVYSGDSSYAGSNAPAITVTIGAAPNIAMTVTPPNFTIASGQHASVVVSLASQKNFTDTFQLGCLGLPYAATCTFDSDNVMVPAGGTPTVNLTVDTGAPLLGGTTARNESSTRSTVLACFLPGSLMLLFFALPSKRLRSMRALLLVLCMAGVMAGLSGCGGLQTNSTPVGNYSFQVTAVGKSGVTQFYTVTMNVGAKQQ